MPRGSNTLLPQVPMASGMPGISPFAAPTTALGAVGDSGGPYAPQAQGLPQRLTTSRRRRCCRISHRRAAAAEYGRR